MRHLLTLVPILAACRSYKTPVQPAPTTTQPAPTTTATVTDDIPKYNQKDWKHWIDADGDCQDTRQEVLIAESEISVTFKTDKNCKVATGRWTCPYTGEIFTDPSKLKVDHLIPLATTHDAGGHTWSKERKQAYANNLDNEEHLVAVQVSAHQNKGRQGPTEWLPSKGECEYMESWLAISIASDLGVDTAVLELHSKECLLGSKKGGWDTSLPSDWKDYGVERLANEQVTPVIHGSHVLFGGCMRKTDSSEAFIEFVVRNNGKVSQVRVNGLTDNPLANCIRHVMMSLSFPSFNGLRSKHNFEINY